MQVLPKSDRNEPEQAEAMSSLPSTSRTGTNSGLLIAPRNPSQNASLILFSVSGNGPLSRVDLDEIDLISEVEAEEIHKVIAKEKKDFVAKEYQMAEDILKIDSIQGSHDLFDDVPTI